MPPRQRPEGRAPAAKKPKVAGPAGPSAEDLRVAAQVAAYNAQMRPKTLAEMHADKLKEEAPAGPAKRVEWNRDRDMAVDFMDKKHTAKIVSGASNMMERFTHGSKKVE